MGPQNLWHSANVKFVDEVVVFDVVAVIRG